MSDFSPEFSPEFSPPEELPEGYSVPLSIQIERDLQELLVDLDEYDTLNLVERRRIQAMILELPEVPSKVRYLASHWDAAAGRRLIGRRHVAIIH